MRINPILSLGYKKVTLHLHFQLIPQDAPMQEVQHLPLKSPTRILTPRWPFLGGSWIPGTGRPQAAASTAVSKGWSPDRAQPLVCFANQVAVKMVLTWQQGFGSRLLHSPDATPPGTELAPKSQRSAQLFQAHSTSKESSMFVLFITVWPATGTRAWHIVAVIRWTDGWMDAWMNIWINEWMDGWMDGKGGREERRK